MNAFSDRLKGYSVLLDTCKKGFFFRLISCMVLAYSDLQLREKDVPGGMNELRIPSTSSTVDDAGSFPA